MTQRLVVLKRDKHVVVVAMQRPESRNALSSALLTELRSAFEDLESDAAVRAVVLTGAGEAAFSAGANLKERSSLNAEQRTAHTAAINRVATAIEQLPVPVIAAIRGFALAGGAELATACDIRVIAEDGVIGFPEAQVGVFPGAGGVLRLPYLVGAGRARDLLFTGRRVNADEALRIGLVDRVAPASEVLPTALSLAADIADNAPLAIRGLKLALNATADLSSADGASIVSRLRAQLDATRDYDEGLSAFAERRKPHFTGQ